MGVSQRIQKLRKERNMSQAMLAEKAGLKPPAISQYESGVRSPNFESLVKLSNALGVPGDYLLMDQEDIIREDVGDALSRLIAHIAGMLDFEKREMLLDYALMLLKTKPSKSILPYLPMREPMPNIFSPPLGGGNCRSICSVCWGISRWAWWRRPWPTARECW